MSKTFYTYIWLREDGTPYYVGKGSSKRAYKPGGRRVCPPKNPLNILVQDFPTEEDAFAAERFLIAYYGRKDLGTGNLANFSDGGEGISNPSQDIRAKLSKVHKGKPHSPEHCRKIGEANRKRVLSAETRLKISLGNKRRPPASPEMRLRMSIGQRNRVHVKGVRKLSLVHRQKIGNSLRGKIRGPYKNRRIGVQTNS